MFNEIIFNGMRMRELPRHPDYWASESGEIYSTKRNKVPHRLRPTLNKRTGMQTVNLYRQDRRYNRKLPCGNIRSCLLAEPLGVHTLISSVWLPPKPSPLHEIDHVNEDRYDHRPNNLRWLTNLQNVKSYQGNHPDYPNALRGEKHPFAKLSESQVREIISLRGVKVGRVIAAGFGVHQRTVHKIWGGRTWRHIPR